LVQKDQTDLNALELRSLHQSIEANRILNDRQMADLQHGSTLDALKVATLSATESGAHDLEAVAVWDPITQEGVLSIRSLPQLGSDQNYQLWLMTADEKVSASGGVFAVNDQGQAHIHFHLEHPIEAARVTITRERLGGAPAPSNPIVATGSF
jgi:anti-sigma-K factor RskA